MGVNITTIDCLRVLIIEIGSTIFLLVVEAQGSELQQPFFLMQKFGVHHHLIDLHKRQSAVNGGINVDWVVATQIFF